MPVGKTVVIHNPVDLKRLHGLMAEPISPAFDRTREGKGDRVDLVSIGRLDYQKGFDLLIRAIAICDDPRLHLTILGDGPLRGELEALAASLDVAGQVCMPGFQRNPYPFLHQADALVLSSRYEGLPNVVLEAMACGTPVIATPAPGGIFELLDGREGCVIAAELTAESLAVAIRAYPFGRSSKPAPPELFEFSAGHIGDQYERLFMDIVGSGR
jgi:glycosyltransferase involved in cell wall biosynthesis